MFMGRLWPHNGLAPAVKLLIGNLEECYWYSITVDGQREEVGILI